MFSRKRLPPELRAPWEAFEQQAQRIEDARRALLGCLPVGRVEPAPVTVGLDLLRDELRAVAAELDRWDVPGMAEHQQAVRAALDASIAEAGRLRPLVERTDELLDVLNAVSHVLEPLDAWRDAERHWRTLRTRGGRSRG